jgi:hypothetical protein
MIGIILLLLFAVSISPGILVYYKYLRGKSLEQIIKEYF